MVPVSTRAPEQAADLGNQISFVFVDLPVQMTSAADRLDAVRAATTRFKEQDRAAGGAAILGSLGAMPGAGQGGARRGWRPSPRTYNLTVSNVPGPADRVWLRGCALREAVPVIPLADGHALSIGIFSYADRITFGAYADPHALPQVADLPLALCAVAARRLRAGGACRQAPPRAEGRVLADLDGQASCPTGLDRADQRVGAAAREPVRCSCRPS